MIRSPGGSTLLLLMLLLASCASLEVSEPADAPTTSTVASPPTTEGPTPALSTLATPAPSHTLSGRVIDPWRRPVVGAVVSAGEAEATTGLSGWFELRSTRPSGATVTKPGWTSGRVEWSGTDMVAHVTLERKKVRGLRVSAGAAGDDEAFGNLLMLASETAVNSFVFDTKQEGGLVVYDTSVAEASAMGAVEPSYDPAARLREAREQGLYAITRVVVFEDVYRAKAFPDEKLAGPWVDPRSEKAWEYNIDLAVEACEMGFDEIQFDYVRFPAGQTALISGQLQLTEEERIQAIEGFLAAARAALRPLGCSVSADVFAIVVSVLDDQGLGQSPEELSRQLDALSPMIYPSHYSLGWLGFADPNDHPYAVTARAIEDARPRLAPGTVLRPWLQAFWWSNEQIRDSIQAAEDRDVGWILWNVRSDFDLEALPRAGEVGE